MPHVDREILHVGADAEIGLLAGGQHGHAIITLAKAQPGLAQLVAQCIAERVVPGSAIHGDGRDVVLAFVADECHGASLQWPACSVIARSEATKQSMALQATVWIASLRSQ